MLVGNCIGSAALSAALSSFSKSLFSLFEIALSPLTSSISFLIAVCGSVNAFVSESIPASTMEMLAATASYSAISLNPCFLVTASSSALYLVLARSEDTFRYRQHVVLGGDEPLDVILREFDLRC